MSEQITVSREQLPTRYTEILIQNPLLQRLEVECKLIGWTNEEIRTFQLLIACASNASLKKHIEQLEIGMVAASKMESGQ